MVFHHLFLCKLCFLKAEIRWMCWFWFFRRKKIVRQIESSDSETEEGKSKDSQRLEEVAHKENNSTLNKIKDKDEDEDEDIDCRTSKLGSDNHRSPKKTSFTASKYVSSQKEYVFFKICLRYGLALFSMYSCEVHTKWIGTVVIHVICIQVVPGLNYDQKPPFLSDLFMVNIGDIS